jgi:quercetin dioxygenase-like cupin family protein
MRWLALSALFLSACATAHEGHLAVVQPPEGINIVLEGPIAGTAEHKLVVGDLVMVPGTVIPRHKHSGEEFLYVMGGTANLTLEDGTQLVLQAGESARIPAGTVHWGHAGEEGLRGVASWVVVGDHPLRILVE